MSNVCTESNTCTGQPISWLRLEQFVLGETLPRESDSIAEHLAECDTCRSCRDFIRENDNRELPPLPHWIGSKAPAAEEHRPAVDRPRRKWFRPYTWTAVAAFAVVLLLFVWPQEANKPQIVSNEFRTKGGNTISAQLVRERNGSIAYTLDKFSAGDRFKLLLTCSLPGEVFADVVVYDETGVAFPLPPASVQCGNGTPYPGAFQITGPSKQTVCVFVSDQPFARDVLDKLADISGRAACLEIAPESPPDQGNL